MMTALVTNEKWPFQFPWCRTLGVHPPLREGWSSLDTIILTWNYRVNFYISKIYIFLLQLI